MADETKKNMDALNESAAEMSENFASLEASVKAVHQELASGAQLYSNYSFALQSQVEVVRRYHKEVEALNSSLEKVVGSQEAWEESSRKIRDAVTAEAKATSRANRVLKERIKHLGKLSEREMRLVKKRQEAERVVAAAAVGGKGASAIKSASKKGDSSRVHVEEPEPLHSPKVEKETQEAVKETEKASKELKIKLIRQEKDYTKSLFGLYRSASKDQKEMLDNLNLMKIGGKDLNKAKTAYVEKLREEAEQKVISAQKDIEELRSKRSEAEKFGQSTEEIDAKIKGVSSEMEKWQAITEEATRTISDEHLKATSRIGEGFAVLSEVFLGSESSYEELAKAQDRLKAAQKTFLPILRNVIAYKESVKRRLEEVRKVAPGTVAAIEAIGGALRAVATLGFGALARFVQILAGIAFQVATFPFAAWRRLVQGMNEATEIADRLRQSHESLRGQFGTLRSGLGELVMDMNLSLQASSDYFESFGVSLSNSVESVFGWFEDARIAMKEASQEIVQDLGMLVFATRDMVEDSVPEMVAFQKGLGLTGEHMKALVRDAHAGGRDIVSDLEEINLASQSLGERFGLDSRGIAQDMGMMRAEFATFGQRSVQEMAQTALYTRRLGIEVSELMGLINQFDDFEGAAQSAATLAQAFGMNVDAMELFSAEAPEERLELIRREFLRTGRSFEDLNRREVRLMAQTVGMSEDAMRQVMIHGKTLEEAQEDAAEATMEGAILSQAEAMDRLGDSIQGMISRRGQFDGIFDAFTKGIEDGLIRTKEFQAVFGEMQSFITGVNKFGIRVGQIIAGNLMPALERVQTFFRTLQQQNLFEDLEGHLTEFLRKIGEPKALQDLFFNVVDTIGGGVRESFREAMKGLAGDRSVEDWVRYLGSEVRGILRRIFTEPRSWLGDGEDGEGVTLVKYFFGEEGVIRRIIRRVLDFSVDVIGEWWEDSGRDMARSVGWSMAKYIGLGLAGYFIAKKTMSFLASSLWSAIRGPARMRAYRVAAIRTWQAAGARMGQAYSWAFRTPISGAVRGLGPLLGSAGLVMAAAVAGWKVGSWVNDSFIEPWREGRRQFRSEISGMTDDALEELKRAEDTTRAQVRAIERQQEERRRLEEEQALRSGPEAASEERRIFRSDELPERLEGEILERRLEFQEHKRRIKEETDQLISDLGPLFRQSRTENLLKQRNEYLEDLYEQYADVTGEGLLESVRNQQQYEEVGESIQSGIAGGMLIPSDYFSNAARTMTNNIEGELEDAIESNSPSQRFAREVGLPITQGIALGVQDPNGLREIKSSMDLVTSTMVRDANRGVEDAISRWGNPIDHFVTALEDRMDDFEILAEGVRDLFGFGELTLEARVGDDAQDERMDSRTISLGDGMGFTVNLNVTLDADQLSASLSSPERTVQLQERS